MRRIGTIKSAQIPAAIINDNVVVVNSWGI
jgi:hypothetical protein